MQLTQQFGAITLTLVSSAQHELLSMKIRNIYPSGQCSASRNPSAFLFPLYLFIIVTLFMTSCRSEVVTNEQSPTAIVVPTRTVRVYRVTATPSPAPAESNQAVDEDKSTPVAPTVAPTLPATEMALTPASVAQAATATATPPEPTVEVTVETATPVSAEIIPSTQLVSLRSGEVRDGTKTALYEQIKILQGQVREMAFELNESRYDDTINCRAFLQGYSGVLNYSPVFDVSAELQLPNFHYNRAVERAILDMNPLSARCEMTIDAGQVQLPVPAYGEANFLKDVEQINDAMMHINEALLWISGDPGKVKTHFVSVRDNLQSYRQLLNRDVDQRCEALNSLFDILADPQKLTPRNAHQEAYRHYLLAGEAMANGATELREQCRGYLPEDHPDAIRPPQPISAEAVIAAQNAADIAIAHILTAIRLMPLPEPVATPTLLDIRLLAKRPSDKAGWYELVFSARVSGEQLQSGFIGGFPIDSNGHVTVIHSCAADFFDHAEVTLVSGQFIETAKFSEPREDVCN